MNDDETWVEGDHANTLNSFDAGDVRTTHAVIAFGHTQGIDIQPSETHTPTLRVGGSGAAIAHNVANALDRQQRPAVVTAAFKAGQGASAGSIGYENEMAPTLIAAPSGSNQVPTIHTEPEMSVRRLIPTECEALMGWPRNHTAPEGVKAPDSKRYAACGDGIVAPVAFWIADRIKMIEGES